MDLNPRAEAKKRKLATEDETTLLTRKYKPVKKREMTADLALSGRNGSWKTFPAGYQTSEIYHHEKEAAYQSETCYDGLGFV